HDVGGQGVRQSVAVLVQRARLAPPFDGVDCHAVVAHRQVDPPFVVFARLLTVVVIGQAIAVVEQNAPVSYAEAKVPGTDSPALLTLGEFPAGNPETIPTIPSSTECHQPAGLEFLTTSEPISIPR